MKKIMCLFDAYTYTLMVSPELGRAASLSNLRAFQQHHDVKAVRMLIDEVERAQALPVVYRLKVTGKPTCSRCGTPMHYKNTRASPSAGPLGEDYRDLVDGYDCPLCKTLNKASRAAGRGRVAHNATAMLAHMVPGASVNSAVIERQLTGDADCVFFYENIYVSYVLFDKLVAALGCVCTQAAAYLAHLRKTSFYQPGGRQRLIGHTAAIAQRLKAHRTGDARNWYAYFIQKARQTTSKKKKM